MTQSSADGSLRAGTSITLIGPGAAGKSTVGALLAERLGIPFVDLDRCFETRAGDISRYINRFGYGAYAALSSGFMTYPRNIHPRYAHLRRCIEKSPTTFVLIPSFMCDVCIAETVRRQLARPFAGSREKEEAVIRERFPIHVGLRARKIETMHPLTVIVEELLVAIRGLTSSSGFRRTLGASVPAAGSRSRAWPSSGCERPA